MERLRERLEVALRALRSFQEVLQIDNPNAIERDAAIQRFEFTFETVWKAAKLYLYDKEGIDAGSPKSVIRACREVGMWDDAETIRLLQMVDDRNLTVHTYNEALADTIHRRLKEYGRLLEAWVSKM